MNGPRTVLPFPTECRKRDCQGETRGAHELKLIDRLKRIGDGLEAGMTLADIQNEYDAQQGAQGGRQPAAQF